ncbi:MAG: hypothetical protein WA144_12290 [Candidatus Methanoperedens sp.]
MVTIDNNLIITLAKYLLYAISILTVGFCIVGGIAFYNTQQGTAKTFSLLIQRANALRLITVFSIVMVSALLALTGIIDGNGVIAILSGIVGYVLGGIQRSKEEKDED